MLLLLLKGLPEVLQTLQLSELNGNDLNEEQGEGISPVAVVHTSGGDHARLEPLNASLSGDHTGLAQDLRGNATSSAKHSPAAVDDLSIHPSKHGGYFHTTDLSPLYHIAACCYCS